MPPKLSTDPPSANPGAAGGSLQESLSSSAAHDPHSVNTVIKRGRGLSNSSSVQRQRSVQGASGRSHTVVTDNGLPPQIPALRRSPSHSQSNSPHGPRSQSTSRSLSRSQSNASLFQSTPSSPVTEVPTQEPFPLRDGAPIHRKNSIPHPSATRLQTRPSMPGSEAPSPVISRTTSSAKLQTLRVDTSKVASAHAAAEPSSQFVMPGGVRHAGTSNDSPQVRRVPVLEIVLDDLFRAFASQADTKIHNCAESRLRLSVRIEDICGPGVDLSFDQLLVNMGFVAKSNPKVLIDKVMNWKRMHDEPRNPTSVASKHQTSHPTDPVKRSVDLHRVNDHRTASAASNRTNNNMPAYSPDAELAERKASAASYILCRTLIDVLSQTTLDALTKPIAVTLANIAFENTVNRVTQDEMVRSSIERAKFAKAVELLGVLSILDFGGVVGRYTLALRELQPVLSDKSYANFAAERHAFNLLRGLRSLQPRVESDMSWFQISAGIQSLVDLFMGVHGEQPKMEYSLTITTLLLRTASSSQTTFDDNKWRKMIGELHARLSKMMSKPKYWPSSYPAQVALACVSPKDIFQVRWQSMIETAPKYLRERYTRLPSLKAICRMTWCFLSRKYESEGTLIKSVEDLARIVFFSGRKYSLSRDPDTIETLIQLVRIIGSVLPSTCFTSIIFPLMGAETIASARGANVQGLDPDRIIIGIRSFLALIEDIETQAKPAFPVRLGDDDEANLEIIAGPTSPAITTKGRPRKVSLIKGKRLSEPVATSRLSDAVQTHYSYFCELLSKLIRSCDNAFGGQASLDEKFSAPTTAKTPFAEAWNFAKRDELLQAEDARLGFYDLLHVAVQALPRCLSPRHPPSSELMNLLCTGTAHVEKDIAASSAASLKSIARQGWAQEVVDRFSAFIFKYENRYATMSDGGQLGPGHIESTLHLYIDLLTVWVEELQRKRGNQGLGLPRLDVSTSQSYVDRAEAQGLFFLCSPSNRVRSFAVEVFELVTKLDSALGETNPRLLNVFSGSAAPMLYWNNSNSFSFKERAHLGRGIKKGNVNGEILNLCKSSDGEEAALWAKVFPYVVSAANSLCYMTVSQTREDVCSRLSQLQPIIEAPREERPRATTASTVDSTSSRNAARSHFSLPDITIEQWKLYLIFACTTITRIEPVTPMPNQDATHTRQNSKSSQTASDTMTNATDLLSNIVPLLFSDHLRIRAAAVVGLGSINVNIYKPLLECLAREIRRQSGNGRRHGTHARSSSSPAREWSGNVYILEVVQVYEATSHFIQEPDVLNDESILDHLANVTREISLYLSHGIHHHCLSMKAHFCGLVERFFEGINKSNAPSRWMAPETRVATYVQFETWWLETQPGGKLSQLLVHETQKLKIASASAMAALCAGPVDGKGPQGFNIPRMLEIKDKMLKGDGDRLQNAGKRALKNLIQHNRHLPILFDITVEMFYSTTKAATLEAYLEVLIDVSSGPEASHEFPWKLMSILLYTLSNTSEKIRMKSLRLLRILEEKHGSSEKLRNYDIRVSDRTRAVNVAAQYNLVEEIIVQHEEYCYLVFSEYSKRIIDLPVDSQRSMIHIMLPWMKKLELHLDSQAQPSATTHMVLMNMLLITVKCESKLHHELQALWHALIDGKYPDNAKAVIDFVIGLALECKNESFIKTARQIAVYMASHEAGKGIYDYLLSYVEPKSMRGDEKRRVTEPPNKIGEGIFVAPLGQVFESATGLISLSIGQLCLILLVDLIVERYIVPLDRVPYLLQAVLVLWDHHLPMVQESAREMLVHLVHVLVISKVDKSVFEKRQVAVEELVELIRNQDSKVSWDYNNNMNQFTPYELPQAMSYVVSETISLFSMAIPDIGDSLGMVAVTWATNCVVRHQACRSWQIYRCLLTGLTPSLVSSMIFQMSGTVSDAHDDVQAYAMDIIRLFRTIAEDQHSEGNLMTQVFWTVCALLYSVHEHEFREAVCILGVLLEKCDPREPEVVTRFLASKPHDFDEAFPGVARFVYNGCRSIYSCDDALVMLDRLLCAPSSPLVGDESRLRITLLANMPRFLHSFENPTVRTDSLQATATLHDVCYARGLMNMAQTLDQYRNGKFRNKREFLLSWASCAQGMLGPDNLRDSFEFIMGMLHNQLPWMRWETLRLLDAIVPLLQPWSAKLAAGGPGLFQPLLALTQTEYCSEALRILDQLLPPASSADSALSRSVSNVGTSDRREDTRDPYGQPGRTGWSVPNVDTRRQLCRKNLEAVHMATLAEGESFDSQQATPGLEFQNDYFPTRPETTIGELTAQLDEMDDFFEVATDGDGDVSDSMTGSSPPQRSLDALEGIGPRRRFTPSPASSQVQVPTLGRRNLSSHSNGGYSNGVTHGAVYPPDSSNGNPQIMSPSAFAAPARSHTRLPSRPQLLARSITMPVNEGLDSAPPQRLGTVPSSPDGEPFSDDEMQWSAGRRRQEAVDDGATIRPDVSSKGSRFGLRSLSLKRLASTSGDRHRRVQTAGTVRGPAESNTDGPQVPKVPYEFLSNNPQSSEP